MDLEETDDLFRDFKRVTLELNSEESKISSPVKENAYDSVDNKKSREKDAEDNNKHSWENNLIAPIASIPQRITETFKNRRCSTVETTSLRPAAELLTGGEAKDFFTFRDGIVNRAVDECVEQFLDFAVDGPLQFSFLLTEISLWDTDKERLILLSTKSIVIVKYDFIAMRRLGYKKLSLESIDTVVIGDLIYPSTSIVPHVNGFIDGASSALQNCLVNVWSKNKTERNLTTYFHPSSRNMRGIRLMWNHGEPIKFITKWNPLNKDVQYTTFTTHPLYFHKDCINDEQKRIYDVEEFIEGLCSLVSKLNSNDNQMSCIIHHKNIILENYVGIGSLIHNRNALGFFKVRGRFSF